MGPSAGAIEVITGPRRTVKLWLAGVGSSLPARSRAFTSKVWAPSARFVMVAVVALAKADQAPPSRRQAKTRLAGGAGGGTAGVSVAVRLWLPTASVRLTTPLPRSVAWASTGTVRRTWVLAGGAGVGTVGGGGG